MKSNENANFSSNKKLMEIRNRLVAERRNFRTHFDIALANLEINKLDKETLVLKELFAA